jgi:hypothetical protein
MRRDETERTHFFGDGCIPPHETYEDTRRKQFEEVFPPPRELSPMELGRRSKAQRARIINAIHEMRVTEDKAKLHYHKYLQRKAEIEMQIDQEYRNRDPLGHTRTHLIDERLGKDTAASSAAANNKWYISQATMYALMAQVELAALEKKILTPE